jgi:hypothetical protein
LFQNNRNLKQNLFRHYPKPTASFYFNAVSRELVSAVVLAESKHA